MIHLRLHSEFSFSAAWGSVSEIAAALPGPAAALTDTGTWGHVAWEAAMLEAKKQPMFGVEVALATGPKQRPKRSVVLIAADSEGLTELYQLVTYANSKERFYYIPQLWVQDLVTLSEHVVLLSGPCPEILNHLKPIPNRFLELSTGHGPGWWRWALPSINQGWLPVVTGDNVIVSPDQRPLYEVVAGGMAARGIGGIRRRTAPQHIITEPELRLALWGVPSKIIDKGLRMAEMIAAHCKVTLPRGEMMVYPDKQQTLRQWCERGAKRRKMWPLSSEEKARMERELDLIAQKSFEDYFYIIADLVHWARERMFVGPGRGSAAGSLVCYLLEITDIHPLKHQLLFERFIDITRADLPDVDIDFPDTERGEIMEYLIQRYGQLHVGRLGTVNRFATQSAIAEVGRMVGLSGPELEALQSMIIRRSSGDARAQFAVHDALTSLDIGKAMLKKYPNLRFAGQMEGRARYSGTHAAGYLVSGTPLSSLTAVDHRGSSQVDKHDAERLSLLKIDVLGLRTLTVLDRCLRMIKKTPDWLRGYPLDDTKAFAVLNEHKYWGIFQFEGYALQSILHQMPVESFNDIVAVTALARPGPLHGGATATFVAGRTATRALDYNGMHPKVREVVEETFGTVVYQEQVMQIGRGLGDMTWEEVTALRKAMSKSLGEEFFNRYWESFKKGALAKGMKEEHAKEIWNTMCTFGSWAFNKSHAVSYGLLSYWCSVLKAHHPLEFAAAQLSHDMDEDSAKKLLRELHAEGIPFTIVDPLRSTESWSVVDGQLLGGLTNIKGVGDKMAKLIVQIRNGKVKDTAKLTGPEKALVTRSLKLLKEPATPFDDLFEGARRFGHLYKARKEAKGGKLPISYIRDIWTDGRYVFLARITGKNIRDLNEAGDVAKRGGQVIEGQTQFLRLQLEDDTGAILGRIGVRDYEKWGVPIMQQARIGDWYLWEASLRNGWRQAIIHQHLRLEDNKNASPDSARGAARPDRKAGQKERTL